MSKPIQQATEVLIKAQKEINQLLKGPEHINNLVGINQHFERIKARFGHIGGVIEHDSVEKDKNQFPPIKNFMGEKVDVNDKTKNPELRPDEAQRQAFVEKVDKLYDGIASMPAHTILNSYTLPQEQLVIRGVAKKADIVDFKEAEITLAFIEDIQKAVTTKKENQQTQKQIDEKNKPVKTTITAEMITADPELQKRKAEPGDELETFPDGKIKVHKASK